jgi:hypothetical protein
MNFHTLMQFVQPMLEQMQLLPLLWIGIHKFLRIPPKSRRVFFPMKDDERISELLFFFLNKING